MRPSIKVRLDRFDALLLLNVPPCRLSSSYWTPLKPINVRNGTKRQSKGIILTTRTIPKRRPPPPPVLLPGRNKATIRPHRLVNEPRRGLRPPLQPPRRRPLRLAPRLSRRPE